MGVQVDVNIFPNMDNFVLMSDETEGEYSYEILDCVLKILSRENKPGIDAGSR